MYYSKCTHCGEIMDCSVWDDCGSIDYITYSCKNCNKQTNSIIYNSDNEDTSINDAEEA